VFTFPQQDDIRFNSADKNTAEKATEDNRRC